MGNSNKILIIRTKQQMRIRLILHLLLYPHNVLRPNVGAVEA